ncbi:hypothetical protein BHE90_011614 [Fusarium euwallaceae]|uniref:Protein kinase domain-containing protein n=1 Tax=Fusarium euwallaceae TaxID=1147111 RepID=A0A430LE08_9HYPO|nr:hypothetical protein BHE90_011614 [Fusarium euwallaceae]
MDGPKSVEELMRLLREAEQRAEEEARRRQEAQQRFEEEARGRQEAQQRAEEARKAHQQEMRRITEETTRIEQETRRITEETTRIEQETRRRREETTRIEQETRRRIEQNRLTTLGEYLTACHTSVSSRFSIATHSRLTSKGPINPRPKWCPKNLSPWSDFLDQQRTTFSTLYDSFPTDRRVFESRCFLAGMGNRMSLRPVANEKTLEYFLDISVMDPVRAIVRQLKLVEEVGRAFQIGDGVIFKNSPHALSDGADEVVERETQDLATSVQTPDHRTDLNKLRPDQICVYRSDNTLTPRHSMVYVCEYKPPHKLTAAQLRFGLRSMDIYKEVMSRPTIPTSMDPLTRFRHHAEKLTASAITQTYHYMIESGLEYGLLTTGQAIVFLKIDWDKPETLYYHLAEPDSEVSAHPDDIDICSAVGQYLAFTLMALNSPEERRGNRQEERRGATEKLKTWTEDFESILASMSEDDRSASLASLKSSSAFSRASRPTTYEGIDRTPKRAGREPSDAPKTLGTTNTEQSTGQGTRRSQRLAQKRGQYCTQKCLLGMARGDLVDPKCPNVALHCKSRDPARVRHPVNHDEWLRLLRKQLEQSLDDGVRPLDEGGARGALFQVTLLAYGYTFISKGTVRAFIKDLEHEAAVYERLKPIQGVHVPVFLGAIDLRSMNKIYYYDHRVYVVHMTFLSWGGCRIDTADDMNRPLEDEATRSLRAMHQEGVVHKDVRLPNMLFNSEIKGVMVIDFERALLLEPPQRPLAQLVPRKRARESEGMDVKKVTGGSSKRQRAHGGFSEDIHLAKIAFWEWNARCGK